MGLIKWFKQRKAIKEELDKIVLEYEESNKLYLDMSIEELKELDDNDLYQAVIMRLETKVDRYKDLEAGIESLIEPQKVAYVLNYFEMEVNNGGLCQFFVNSSRMCAPYISDYLEIIGAYKHKTLYDEFVDRYKIDVNDLSSFIVRRTKDYQKQVERNPFDEFDDQFYELESFEEKLVNYIRKHIQEY